MHEINITANSTQDTEKIVNLVILSAALVVNQQTIKRAETFGEIFNHGSAIINSLALMHVLHNTTNNKFFFSRVLYANDIIICKNGFYARKTKTNCQK